MNTIHFFFSSLGAFLVGFYFVFFGVWNAFHWTAIKNAMSLKKIPLPALVLTLGIIFETTSGSLLMLGIYVQFAALLLIPFTLIAIFMFHAFWRHEGELRQLNLVIFVTNLICTLGALCLLLGTNS